MFSYTAMEKSINEILTVSVNGRTIINGEGIVCLLKL